MGLIKTSQPALHGDQHLADGSDPIPGLISGSGLPSVTFSDYVLSLSNLIGYWRLGEGASPFADTSGYAPGSPADLTVVTRGHAYDPDEPGALTVDDDGCVKFTSNGSVGDYLRNTSSAGRFDFGSGLFTVSAWVKVLADVGTFEGEIVGNLKSSPYTGWSLRVEWPARTIAFTFQAAGGTLYYVASPTLLANTWYLITGVSGASGLELFVNGVSVGTSTRSGVLPSWGSGITVGGAAPNATDNLFFYGWVDEVAIWDAALTDDEVAGLYTAGVAPGVEADGKVLTADGAGGTGWEYPTVDVDGTRYDEILTGTNLTSTDNTDGTVTIDATGGPPTGSAGGALDGTYPNPGIAASVAGAGLSETSNVLAVNVDNSTVEISTDTVRVKADGITANEIAANAVGSSELASTAVTPGSYGDTTHIAGFTVDADGRLTAASNVAFTAGTSPTDTAGWMPLTTVVGGVPDLVWDSTDSLIPTYGPF